MTTTRRRREEKWVPLSWNRRQANIKISRIGIRHCIASRRCAAMCGRRKGGDIKKLLKRYSPQLPGSDLFYFTNLAICDCPNCSPRIYGARGQRRGRGGRVGSSSKSRTKTRTEVGGGGKRLTDGCSRIQQAESRRPVVGTPQPKSGQSNHSSESDQAGEPRQKTGCRAPQ